MCVVVVVVAAAAAAAAVKRFSFNLRGVNFL